MSGAAPPPARAGRDLPRWLIYVVILGLYLSLRGYHSLDSDQSYRLPLLLHQQDPSLYANDPFVRAFDAFNPHRGSLLVLNLVTRPFGLSAGLFLIFVLTFSATCLGFDRLAQATWPEAGPAVGLTAVGLLLAAKAGNIGTNHLFEAMVLDRLMAFALGWLALAATIAEPNRGPWRAMAAIAAATWIHPSLGLQLALVLAASWMAWALLGRWMDVTVASAVRGVVGLGVAALPGLAVNVAPGSSLQGNMPTDVFWLLSVELQGPQHMLPHLWRMPQWLAWGCYLSLTALALAALRPSPPTSPLAGSTATDSFVPWPAARLRLVAVLAVVLIALAVAWRAIEGFHLVSLTVFQPFRMATLARGIALVFVAGRLVALWRRGDWIGRLRVILITVAFIGDWLLVVVALAELAVSAAEAIRARLPWCAGWRFLEPLVFLTMLALGLNFLGHHDTEYGNRTLAATLGVALVAGVVTRLRTRNFPPVMKGGAGRQFGGDSPVRMCNFPSLVKRGAGGGRPNAVDDTAVPAAFAVFGFSSDLGSRPLTRPAGTLSPSGRGEERLSLTNERGDRDKWSPSPHRGEGRGEGAGLRTGSRPHPPLPPLHREGKGWLVPALLIASVWITPLAALLAATVPLDHAASRLSLVRGLVNRCRFAAVPIDDIERLGLWCRDHTPQAAGFIGPPGPKTFRLWSRRSLAFNRAASPYHADGLADWFARFQDHVDFHGSPAEFVRSYVNNRHGFEARYQTKSDADRAALALRQGATYVIAAAPSNGNHEKGAAASPEPLELLHVEGRYAVYRVNPE